MRRDNTLFVLALLVATSLRFAGAKTRTKKKDDLDVPSFARSSLGALKTARPSANAVRVRPDDEEEKYAYGGSFNMQESTSSLADHLATISSENGNEFANRLLSEQERVDSATASAARSTSGPTSLVLTIVGGSALLFFTAQLLSPYSSAAIGQDLWMALLSALSVSWLPWMWSRPASTANPTATTDFLAYVHLFADVELLQYLWLHIAPLSFQTFRKMLTMELWNRFWTATFRQATLLFPVRTSPTQPSSKKGSDTPPLAAASPAWLVESHSFLVGTIQRGTKKIFQSTLQKHLQDAITSLFQATYATAREKLLSTSIY
jgi:hypothetical protein